METSKMKKERSSVTMNPPGGGGIPPPILSILPFPLIPHIFLTDSLVRPRGLPIMVHKVWWRWLCHPTYQNFMEQRCHQKYPTLQFRPSPNEIVMMTL